MNQKKSLYIFFSIMMIFVFVLGGCSPAVSPMHNASLIPEKKGADTNLAQEEEGDEDYSDEDWETEPTKVSPSQKSASDGPAVADLGFRPEKDGFNFENYGSEADAKNLTVEEIQRMFGDQVCSSIQDGKCVLSPTGQQWMDATNNDMAGGHCEGFAALSLLMYANKVDEKQFGGNITHDLTLSSEKLQREIAYWWATQAVSPTLDGLIKGTPNDILQELMTLKPGGETYTIGIYKRDGSGGHAITPFAVEDNGDGTYSVLVYDNNYPNDTRKLMIDSNNNTWSYEAAINPNVESEVYEGDAETQSLDLTPTSIRMGVQYCPFCASSDETARGINGLAASAPKYNQVYLDGEGHLLIEDEKGNQLGYLEGKMVNKIPGAKYASMKVDKPTLDSPEPIYMLPEGLDVKATIDGSALKEESLTDLEMIGQGFSIGVEEIGLSPKQKDTVEFYPKDQIIVYDTDSTESPNFVVTIEQANGTDYEFEIFGTDMEGGGTITVALDTKAGDLLINTEKLKNEGNFNIILTRYTEKDEESYEANDIVMKAGAIVYVNYSEWKGNGQGLLFGVDTNGDGEIDEEYTQEDAK